MQKDLETIEATKTDGGSGGPARSVQVAAVREYERALLWAFDEYLEATTDDVPEDEEERHKWALRDLERRAGRVADEFAGSRNEIGGGDPRRADGPF